MNNMIEKLEEILQTKEAIKIAIENKGQEVGDAPLADYASKIDNMSSSGDMSLYALIEDVGKNEDLSTVDKETLVGAINELKAMLDDIGTVTDPDGIVDALNKKADKETIGNLEELQTEYKESIVYAINELYSMVIYSQDELLDKVNQEDFDNELGIVQDAIEMIAQKPGQPGPQGPPGQPGEPGQPGADGADGLSAYQIWLGEGNEGTEQDFLESLEGPQGPPGEGSGGDYNGSVYNLGSYSSDEVIENYTNIFKAQVSVSENSSATAVYRELLINISETEVERWEPVDMHQIRGNPLEPGYLEAVYLVNGSIYAEVHDEEPIHIQVADKREGAGMGMELYPVRFAVAPSQVNASYESEASGIRSQVNASYESTASGYDSQVNASSRSTASGYDSQVNASEGVLNDTKASSAWGFELGDLPSTQNIKIHLLSQSGDINHSGILNSGHNFTDYAELFPNLVGEEQGYGLIQTIDGHGVRPANSGDQVVGVTSATAGVILGETSFSWAERWLKDEWGSYIMEDVTDEDWEPSEDETEEDRPVHRLPKENPNYDPEREHAKRQDRPDEWTVVGLVGQVYVRLDENVQPMDYVKPLKDGVGQTSDEPTNIRVMKITQKFDEDKGYQIGFCLLK